jgi:hypothetical protein
MLAHFFCLLLINFPRGINLQWISMIKNKIADDISHLKKQSDTDSSHLIDMGHCVDQEMAQTQRGPDLQFIVMMEDAQNKAKRAGMPIADVELVMMVLAAILAAQHFL